MAAQPTANPCFPELQKVDACIAANLAECGCYGQPFMETFPTAVENSYQSIVASHDPTNPEFCNLLHDDICGFLEATASCCCQIEAIEYNVCIFAKDIVTKYEVFQTVPCDNGGSCSLTESDGESSGLMFGVIDPSSDDVVIYGVVASIVLLILSVLCYFFCSRRSRRRRVVRKTGDQGGIKVNVVCKEKNTSNNKEEYVNTTSETKNAQIHQDKHPKRNDRKKPTKEEPDESSVDYYFDWGRWKDSTRHKTNTTVEESESSNYEDCDWSQYQNSKDRSKRNIESGSIKRLTYDQESRRRERKKIEESESHHRRRSRELRNKRRDIENWYEDEKLRRSHRTLVESSDGEDSERSSSRRKRKKKSKRKKKETVEESVRQARTVMEDYDDEKEQRQILALIPNLREVINLLEDEKRFLDRRSKEVEEEKLNLRMEIKDSKRQLKSLENFSCDVENQMTKAELNKELVEKNFQRSLRRLETKKKESSRDMRKMKEETEEMSKLLDMLKQTQREVEDDTRKKENALHQLKMETTLSEKNLALLEIAKAEEEKQVVKEGLRTAELAGRKSSQKRLKRENDEDPLIQEEVRRKQTEKEHMLRRLAELQSQNKDLESQLTEVEIKKDGSSKADTCSRTSSESSFIPQPCFLDGNSSGEESNDFYGTSPHHASGSLEVPDSPGFGLYCDIEAD